MTAMLSPLAGVVVLLTMAATRSVVAREFASLAVDRSRPRTGASSWDAGARRALPGAGADVRGADHVPDPLGSPDDHRAASVMHPAFTRAADTPVYAALAQRRSDGSGNHLAVVRDGPDLLGPVTLADARRRRFPWARRSPARQG